VDLAKFAEELRQGIVVSLRAFREQHPTETPYAYALLGGQVANYLGMVIATEEGLQRVAAKYAKLGYRYNLFDEGIFDEDRPATIEELTVWLRWANPDDGWHLGELPNSKRVQKALDLFGKAGRFGQDGEDFEEFCTNVLASLQDMPAWRAEMARAQVVVGFTYGSDPRDFLRTATRANPYPVVRCLWRQTWEADELQPRIQAPRE
jgi:hypothetical protein